MTRVTVGTRRPSVQTENRGATAISEATQPEVNTGTATGVFVSPSTLQGRIDTDGTLAENSDVKIPSQKAVKTYVDANGGGGSWGSITGTLSSQTDLQTALNAKQATLVSATNIKTINGNTLLGSGDLAVTGGGVSGLTATRIPYAQDAVTLIDSANLTWDNTNAALTVGTMRIMTQGTNGTHGHYAGYLAGTTSAFVNSDGRNTAFGYRALRSLTPGAGATDASYNTAVGWDAGQAITSGRFNTVVGHACGDAITTGIFNTAIGNGALGAVSTQSSNTAVGYLAMGSATCAESVAIGHNAANLFQGVRCVAIGWGALAKTTTGNYNIAIGSECLQENVTGAGNVAIGFYSGVYAKGADNVFVGHYSCGQATVTATDLNGNVMIGSGSGNTDTPANRSTDHDYSTFIGYQSGLGSTTQCSYSTAIGYRAKVYTDRSMVFGSEVDADRVNYGFGGEGYGGGKGVLFIKNAVTDASAAGTNGIIIHAKDASTGSANSTLALYLEEAPEATATFTQTHRLKIWINGVEYYLSLDAV